ncbi:MAG: hypothetical protein ACREUV_03685 [Burkholderiales bacterium]
MTTVPQIQIKKSSGRFFNIVDFPALPAHTPFGNLHLKYSLIAERLDYVNSLIQDTFEAYEKTMRQHSHALAGVCDHRLLAEQIIYWLRKTADELIALVWVLSERESKGTYPTRVNPDSIGRVINAKDIPPAIKPHLDFLGLLNEISNAYKHSFINSDISLIGEYEPVVNALALKQNDLANPADFHSVSLREIIDRFDEFFLSADARLRECKLPHLTPGPGGPLASGGH